MATRHRRLVLVSSVNLLYLYEAGGVILTVLVGIVAKAHANRSRSTQKTSTAPSDAIKLSMALTKKTFLKLGGMRGHGRLGK